jgi:hypothetical protein
MMQASPVPGYALEQPTHATMLQSLARYVDDDEALELWTTACRDAAIDLVPHDIAGASCAADDLLRAVDCLARGGELAAACAKGMRIRLLSYIVLSRAAAQQGAACSM